MSGNLIKKMTPSLRLTVGIIGGGIYSIPLAFAVFGGLLNMLWGLALFAVFMGISYYFIIRFYTDYRDIRVFCPVCYKTESLDDILERTMNNGNNPSTKEAPLEPIGYKLQKYFRIIDNQRVNNNLLKCTNSELHPFDIIMLPEEKNFYRKRINPFNITRSYLGNFGKKLLMFTLFAYSLLALIFYTGFYISTMAAWSYLYIYRWGLGWVFTFIVAGISIALIFLVILYKRKIEKEAEYYIGSTLYKDSFSLIENLRNLYMGSDVPQKSGTEPHKDENGLRLGDVPVKSKCEVLKNSAEILGKIMGLFDRLGNNSDLCRRVGSGEFEQVYKEIKKNVLPLCLVDKKRSREHIILRNITYIDKINMDGLSDWECVLPVIRKVKWRDIDKADIGIGILIENMESGVRKYEGRKIALGKGDLIRLICYIYSSYIGVCNKRQENSDYIGRILEDLIKKYHGIFKIGSEINELTVNSRDSEVISCVLLYYLIYFMLLLLDIFMIELITRVLERIDRYYDDLYSYQLIYKNSVRKDDPRNKIIDDYVDSFKNFINKAKDSGLLSETAFRPMGIRLGDNKPYGIIYLRKKMAWIDILLKILLFISSLTVISSYFLLAAVVPGFGNAFSWICFVAVVCFIFIAFIYAGRIIRLKFNGLLFIMYAYFDTALKFIIIVDTVSNVYEESYTNSLSSELIREKFAKLELSGTINRMRIEDRIGPLTTSIYVAAILIFSFVLFLLSIGRTPSIPLAVGTLIPAATILPFIKSAGNKGSITPGGITALTSPVGNMQSGLMKKAGTFIFAYATPTSYSVLDHKFFRGKSASEIRGDLKWTVIGGMGLTFLLYACYSMASIFFLSTHPNDVYNVLSANTLKFPELPFGIGNSTFISPVFLVDNPIVVVFLTVIASSMIIFTILTAFDAQLGVCLDLSPYLIRKVKAGTEFMNDFITDSADLYLYTYKTDMSENIDRRNMYFDIEKVKKFRKAFTDYLKYMIKIFIPITGIAVLLYIIWIILGLDVSVFMDIAALVFASFYIVFIPMIMNIYREKLNSGYNRI